MRYIAIFILAVFSFSVFAKRISAISQPVISSNSTPTPQVEYVLPYPGILPDHPLYFLKTMRDQILIFLTRDPVKKIHITLLLSDKRVVMSQLLWEKGSTDLSLSTFTKAEKYLLTAAIDLVKLKKQNNLPPGLSDKVELAAKKHEEIISKLLSGISDESGKQSLNQSIGIIHQATQQILLTK